MNAGKVSYQAKLENRHVGSVCKYIPATCFDLPDEDVGFASSHGKQTVQLVLLMLDSM